MPGSAVELTPHTHPAALDHTIVRCSFEAKSGRGRGRRLGTTSCQSWAKTLALAWSCSVPRQRKASTAKRDLRCKHENATQRSGAGQCSRLAGSSLLCVPTLQLRWARTASSAARHWEGANGLRSRSEDEGECRCYCGLLDYMLVVS